MSTRVRFAPSPTGFLHVGSARTALFNWIHARAVGGAFVLRIEDTDAERSRQELIDDILRTLEWLGIDWDEGPYRQSERRDRHAEAVEQLLAADVAYHDEGAVRFRVPDEGVTGWDDVVRGPIEFENSNLEDFVIRRSDGSVTFLLANAVDDIDMGITTAIRGEDLINTVPKVLLLMRALGAPGDLTYAHLPLLVDHQRKKLSKRRHEVAVEDYRAKGFVAEAVANYLGTLGWGPPDGVEVRPMSEIVERFRLEDVTKASAAFDLKKLTHFNADWIRMLPTDEFIARCEPWLAEAPWPAEHFDAARFATIAPLVQERVRTLAEVPNWVDWLFLADAPHDESSWEKAMVKGPDAGDILDDAHAAFADCTWDAETLGGVITDIGTKRELKTKFAQAPVRVACLGRSVGPPLFESLELLGREETLRRIEAARQRL
ncbi:MAG: glutamate--tRNA ligase family protein [Actinomycetota bacterium]|nr:glutamate--tRNA ligase family protein [Actinomycetota bacterium]